MPPSEVNPSIATAKHTAAKITAAIMVARSESFIGSSARSSALAQEYVHRALAGHALLAFIAQCVRIDTLEEILARAHQQRSDRQMQLVYQSCPQVLPDRRDAAAEPHIAAARCGLGLLERAVD